MLLRYESLYSDSLHFLAVRRKHEERGRPCKSLSKYLLCSHPTTLSLTDSYQRLTPTFLFGFQNSTA